MPEENRDLETDAYVPGTGYDGAIFDTVQYSSIVLVALCWGAWIWQIPNMGMRNWGISGAALTSGHYETLFLHMFAHAGLMHLVFNTSALLELAGPVMLRMGTSAIAWVRFYGMFLLSGLAGACTYLAINPAGSIPAVGASGAICGLVGLVSRFQADQHALLEIRSREFGERAWGFIKANIVLIALFTLPILLIGGSGGVAWEAHLGGFLFGMFLGPRFLDHAA